MDDPFLGTPTSVTCVDDYPSPPGSPQPFSDSLLDSNDPTTPPRPPTPPLLPECVALTLGGVSADDDAPSSPNASCRRVLAWGATFTTLVSDFLPEVLGPQGQEAALTAAWDIPNAVAALADPVVSGARARVAHALLATPLPIVDLEAVVADLGLVAASAPGFPRDLSQARETAEALWEDPHRDVRVHPEFPALAWAWVQVFARAAASVKTLDDHPDLKSLVETFQGLVLHPCVQSVPVCMPLDLYPGVPVDILPVLPS